MPAIPSDLTERERLKPLTAEDTGQLVAIDRGVLAELYERLAEAIGAVERGNHRAAGVERWFRCVDAIWRTGKTPTECNRQP